MPTFLKSIKEVYKDLDLLILIWIMSGNKITRIQRVARPISPAACLRYLFAAQSYDFAGSPKNRRPYLP